MFQNLNPFFMNSIWISEGWSYSLYVYVYDRKRWIIKVKQNNKRKEINKYDLSINFSI
uniref:Uncharacterized protein n=1 Tax=Rhizophora mucronata TaxID=61149 RepID=A0A2P2NMU9_RHIMU